MPQEQVIDTYTSGEAVTEVVSAENPLTGKLEAREGNVRAVRERVLVNVRRLIARATRSGVVQHAVHAAHLPRQQGL